MNVFAHVATLNYREHKVFTLKKRSEQTKQNKATKEKEMPKMKSLPGKVSLTCVSLPMNHLLKFVTSFLLRIKYGTEHNITAAKNL